MSWLTGFDPLDDLDGAWTTALALGHSEVTLLRLDAHQREYVMIAHGLAGQVFTADEPFEISFDPAGLLEPKE